MSKNKSPSNRRYQARRNALKRRITPVEYDFYKRNIKVLCEQFPAVFNKTFPAPLLVGIHGQLLSATKFTEQELSTLLKIWVQRHEYQYMMCSVKHRRDLDGNPATPIEEAHLEWAIQRVNKMRPGSIRKWCKRYLKLTGRPGLICIPISKRPNLEKTKDDQAKDKRD